MRPADDGFHHVVIIDAPYYADSPAQARPPEGALRAGTRVRPLEQGMDGHVRIETEDGTRGRVARDALARDATLEA